MKKAKFLLLSMIFVMCFGVMTGCGKKDTDDGSTISDGVTKATRELITVKPTTNSTEGLPDQIATSISEGAGELATDISKGVNNLGDRINGTQAESR